MVDVIVIGGGISGLSAAYTAVKRGHSVVLLESSSRVGGVCESITKNGFLIERGPNSTMRRPVLNEMIEELGLEDEVVTPRAKARFLALGGKLIPAPHSLSSAITSPLLSPSGKARIFKDLLLLSKKGDDSSVLELSERHFGPELTRNLLAAGLSGIYAADISKLSARSALPTLWEAKKRSGSILRGLLKRKRNSESKGKREIISFHGGLARLTETLAEKIGPEVIRVNTPVPSVHHNRMRGVVEVSTLSGMLSAKVVILALSAEKTSQVIQEIYPVIARQIASIPYPPLGILHLAFKKDSVTHSLDGFGFLKPPHLSSPLLGAIFNSSLFPGRAPEGYHLLTCMVGGGARAEGYDVRDSGTRKQVIEELKALIGATADPEILTETIWERAIPTYPVGHHRLVAEIRRTEELAPQIRFLGNWCEGISFGECAERGVQCAVAVSEELYR